MPATQPARVCPRQRRGASTRLRDRGSASLQIVVLMPALFLMMFVGMQAALIYHGRTVAIAAAQEGARSLVAPTATLEAGRTAAEEFVEAAGGADVLREVTVAVTRDPTTATVVVTGTTLSVVPGWVPHLSQQVSAPVERITG